MPRIKRGVTTRQKHKRILDQAKGYRGRRKNTIRIARQAVEKAGQKIFDRDENSGRLVSQILAEAFVEAVTEGFAEIGRIQKDRQS